MEMKSVPANGAVTDKMIEAGFKAWTDVMEGEPSQRLGGDALILLMLMTAWRDMVEACENFQ